MTTPSKWEIAPRQALIYGLDDLLDLMGDFRRTVSDIEQAYAALATEARNKLSNTDTGVSCRS